MEKSIGVFESFRLEGRKRGCVVLKENGKIRISRGSESYYVKSGWCSRSDVSAKYVRNKAATRGYLKSLGFPVAEGDIFSALDKEKAADYADFLGYPVVIKPNDLNKGEGVFVDIKNRGEFLQAYTSLSEKVKYIVVEKHVFGDEYRFLLAGGKVVGILLRDPANVVGNGESDIRALVADKNVARAALRHPKIKLDESLMRYIGSQGLSLSYVPGFGERVQLRGVSNISAGGDRIDVTESVSSWYINAIEEIAVKHFSGIAFSGFDVFISNPGASPERGGWAICEVNDRPHLNHYSVWKGKPRGVAEVAIDMFFPETSLARAPLMWKSGSGLASTYEVRIYGDVRNKIFPHELAREARLRGVFGQVGVDAERGVVVAELCGNADGIWRCIEWCRISGRDYVEKVFVQPGRVKRFGRFRVLKQARYNEVFEEGDFQEVESPLSFISSLDLPDNKVVFSLLNISQDDIGGLKEAMRVDFSVLDVGDGVFCFEAFVAPGGIDDLCEMVVGAVSADVVVSCNTSY